MTWAWVLIRFAVLWISVLGYVGFFRAFCAIPTYYSYVFSLSVIGCIMFFAGLAGVLLTAAYVLLGLGLVLLLTVMIARRFRVAFRRPVLTLTNALFLAWFGFVFASLINYRLIHFDNFSHWALVVKQMLITNAIPDTASTIIEFNNYPLGTASFIYYVCTIVGHSDGVMRVAQIMLIFAAFYALFGVYRDHKRFLLAAILGLCCAIISYFNINIRVNNLLVEYVLPLFALAAIAGMMENSKNYRLACLSSIPVIGMLLIIKNTGLLFAIPAYVYLLFIGHGSRKSRRFAGRIGVWLGSLCAIAASLTTLVLWNIHTAQTFANEASKFAIRFEFADLLHWQSFIVHWTDKTPQQAQAIANLFVSSAISLNSMATQGLLLMNILVVVLWLNARFGFSMRWKLLRILALMDLLMAVYYAGILLVYIVIMPLEEASRLAGFDRYASSMLIFVIGILGLCIVRDVERSLYVQQGEERDYRAFKTLQTKRIYQWATLALFSVALLFFINDLSGMNAAEEKYAQTLPAQAETVLGNRWEASDGSRYLLYAPYDKQTDTQGDQQQADEYLKYIGRYLLFNPKVDATSTVDDALAASVANYDYFVIVQSDPSIQAFMQQQTGLDGTIGVYGVKESFGGLLNPA